jgi:hypothetical protein
MNFQKTIRTYRCRYELLIPPDHQHLKLEDSYVKLRWRKSDLVQQWPHKLLLELSYFLHSCSRYGVVAARLTSERPGSVIPVSKTFTVLGVHSQLQQMSVSLIPTENASCYALCFSRYQLSSLLRRQQLAGNLVSSIFMSNGKYVIEYLLHFSLVKCKIIHRY